jgi:hypothetical protein
VARNRLKLPDLGDRVPIPATSITDRPIPARRGILAAITNQLVGVRDFFLGDPLIRANRRFGTSLEGIYRRGDIYLRWLQRLSAASFGTRLGRLLVLYLVLPFGGAYLLLEGGQHLVEEGIGFFSPPLLSRPDEIAALIGLLSDPQSGPINVLVTRAAVHTNRVSFVTPYTLLPLGIFLVLLLHVPAVRRGIVQALLQLWRLTRYLTVDLPTHVFNWTPLRAILQSRPYLIVYLFLLKPLMWSTPIPLLLYWLDYDRHYYWLLQGSLFVFFCVLLNSRMGLHVGEAFTDWLVRTWAMIRVNIIPETIQLIWYVFKRALEEIERFFYTVDEWFRFRRGDSRLALILKPVLGLIWYCITYVLRLTIILFIEPTYNPIKHFPVVTVAAKLMLPIIPLLDQIITGTMGPLVGLAGARLTLGVVLFWLPGLAGFLVWELKENWRLYRVNQSPALVPESIGHHGETVLQLMRPGIHSGTLPKLYARLRHSERANESAQARKQIEALHQIHESVRHFVSRDLLAILDGSRGWHLGESVLPGEIHTATNQICIELRCMEIGDSHLQIEFEEHAGWLVAGIAQAGWLERLTPEQLGAFTNALAGFYKLAGVDLVREQLAALLPASACYTIGDRGLTVWYANEPPAIYDLEISLLAPNPPLPDLPRMPADRMLFSATPIYWNDWVNAWELDRAGRGQPLALIRDQRLLPELPQQPAEMPAAKTPVG